MRKRIALLTAQLEEKYIKDFTEGFMERSFSCDYDVCIFASFDKEPDCAPKEVSESNIFSLINWQEFDAFVVTPDVLSTPGLMLSIEEKLLINAGSKPVLFVDQKNDYFPYVLMNQYDPIVCITEHMIVDHGFKDIAFISGPKHHLYARQRLEAFVSCMNKHGLEVPDENIFYGNFWFDGGIKVIEDIVREGKKMPKAFICSNDFMALGVCEALVENGFDLPGEVAVAGFDSVEMGRECPVPITSVPLPFREYGIYVADSIHNLIIGEDIREFTYDWKLFEGETCGCKPQIRMEEKTAKYNWNINKNLHNIFSRYSGLTETLVLQTNFRSLIDSIQTYSYQIREFESFVLCLNDVWAYEDIDVEETEIRQGYTDKMCPVLICGPTGKGADVVNYGIKFDTKDMLPLLYDECDHPRGFIFSPVAFDDITFGYAALSYGDEPKCYDVAYSAWLHTVMLGIECFRRNASLLKAKEVAEEIQINDSVTGMFNYDGFIKHAKPMIDRSLQVGLYNTILAIEVDGIDEINSRFGRKEGEKLLHEFALLVYGASDEGAMCCRLGRDVIIIAELSEKITDEVSLNVLYKLKQSIKEYNASSNHNIKIYSGIATGNVDNLSQMEDLVNNAVSQKNGNKSKEIKMRNLNLSDDEIEKLEVVKMILDDNLFDYHFQPIVNAKDGSIYAYEALMRPRVQPRISPLDVLKCAQHLDRLYDVEKATFINVLQRMNAESEKIAKRKVFINSIPGTRLNEQDTKNIYEKMQKMSGHLVIELTEQAEASDDELSEMKQLLINMGIETAVDDYGTGYSNIVNLLRYMPNYVKIDRMLLSEIQDNPQKIHFVKDIVDFARENKFKVLAEGVETKEELETVIKLGVDFIQGYYTSRPNSEIIDNISEEIKTQIIQFNRAV